MSIDSPGFITCPLCGCACGLNLLPQQLSPDQPICITVLPSAAPGWGVSGLCMRGWQIGEMLQSRRRLRHPLAWLDGEQQRVTWDEALDRARGMFGDILGHDPSSVGIILGDSLSNEEIFAARLFADMLGTPNVAALGLELDAPIIHGLDQVMGAPYRAPETEELDGADLFICVNSNYQHVNPRAAGAMARRLQQGARMVLIDEVDQGLEVWSEVYARHRPGMRAAALRQIANALTRGGDMGGPLAKHDVAAILELIDQSRRVAVPFSSEALASTDEAFAIAQLSRAMRSETRWVGIYLLPSGANTFGTIDMLAPDGSGPGGMGALEMMSAGSGIRCLISIGEDLGRLFGPTDLSALRQRLEMGISLSSFVSPTSSLADLTLPVATSGEREGTIRRPDGRVWWSEHVLEPAGEARTINSVLEALAPVGADTIGWSDQEATWEAIRARVPGYGHLELADLRAGELPAVGMDTARLSDVVAPSVLTAPPVEVPSTDDEHPYLLLPRSTRGGWTTDPRCQAAHILRREATLYREPYVLVRPENMETLGVRDGERVRLVTNHGAATVRVRADEGLPPELAVLPTEFPGLIRTLAGIREGTAPEHGQPTSPLAGDVRPVETR